MKTASEKRKENESTLSENASRVLSEIEKRIDSEKEKFSIYYYESIPLSVSKVLKKAGYNMNDLSSQRDGTCYEIKW